MLLSRLACNRRWQKANRYIRITCRSLYEIILVYWSFCIDADIVSICENWRVTIPTWILSMHMQNLVKFHLFVLKILSGNKILTEIKGYNSVVNLRKLTCNNPNLDAVKVTSTIKNSVCCHPTDPEKLPLPKKFYWSSWKRYFFYFMFSDSVFQFLLYFPSKNADNVRSKCAVVNRGATERGMNWNKCHSLLYSYLKSLLFNSVCKKKENAYLPTHTQNTESGDSKQIIF